MTKPHFIAFSGSTRAASLNKKLISIVAEQARKAGAEVTLVDLKDYPMPIYDGDLESESGLPEAATVLKEIFAKADGFLIASPEYNSSYSPLLKNTIDWLSRSASSDEPPMKAFAGKSAALFAASPSGMGGLRGLTALRELLFNIGVSVTPKWVTVASAHQAFDDNSQIKDESLLRRIDGVLGLIMHSINQ